NLRIGITGSIDCHSIVGYSGLPVMVNHFWKSDGNHESSGHRPGRRRQPATSSLGSRGSAQAYHRPGFAPGERRPAEVVHRFREPRQFFATLRTFAKMRLALRTWGHDRTLRELLVGQVAQTDAAHAFSPKLARIAVMPRYKWVFTVLTGIPVVPAISSMLRPSKNLSRNTRRWLTESRPSAVFTCSVRSCTSSLDSGELSSDGSSDAISVMSREVAWALRQNWNFLSRNWSRIRLFAMPINHVLTAHSPRNDSRPL